jgi:hypothetical protein
LVFAGLALGQTETSIPSKDEIFELLDKADQKISAFEDSVRSSRPKLDEIDPKLAINYLDATSTAHLMVQAMHKNGASGYVLVGLLATLDDLSLDAANASVKLLYPTKARQPNAEAVAAVVLLSNSGTACNDIAELLMHATLRYIHVEEEALQKLLGNQR